MGEWANDNCRIGINRIECTELFYLTYTIKIEVILVDKEFFLGDIVFNSFLNYELMSVNGLMMIAGSAVKGVAGARCTGNFGLQYKR